MANLYADLTSETGLQVHKIANRRLCADFYYGSAAQSVKGATVCFTVEPEKQEAVATVQLISPRGVTTLFEQQKFIMPQKKVLLSEVV